MPVHGSPSWVGARFLVEEAGDHVIEEALAQGCGAQALRVILQPAPAAPFGELGGDSVQGQSGAGAEIAGGNPVDQPQGVEHVLERQLRDGDGGMTANPGRTAASLKVSVRVTNLPAPKNLAAAAV